MNKKKHDVENTLEMSRLLSLHVFDFEEHHVSSRLLTDPMFPSFSGRLHFCFYTEAKYFNSILF